MKRGLMKGKLMKKLLVFLMALSMLLGMAQTAAADAASPTGSISVTLGIEDGGTVKPLSGVTLNAYKVGDYVNYGGAIFFTALGEFIDAGYIGDGTFYFETDGEAAEAAQNMQAAVEASKVQPTVTSPASEADGKLVFSNLPVGMYLINLASQGTAINGTLKMQPMLLSIPYADATNGEWKYDITAVPKLEIQTPPPVVPDPNVSPVLSPIPSPEPTATPEPTPTPGPTATPEPTPTPEPGQITVTKQIYYVDSEFNMAPMIATNTTYRVGLYMDAAGTIPYGSVQDINVQGSSSGTVVWTDVPDGTYYLFELDESGNKISQGEVVIDGQVANLQSVITDESGSTTNSIEVDSENGGRHFYVNNNYYEIPEGYSLEGRINVSKNVLVNGTATIVDDTFYAGVFKEGADGTLEMVGDVITLNQNGTVTVNVPIDTEGEEAIPTKYYVYETDAEGNLLDKDGFEYTVSGESSVTLENEGADGTVVITNSKEVEVTPTPVNNATPTPSGNTTGGDGGNGGSDANVHSGTTSRTSVRTGDETPIALYVVIILVAAAVIGGIVIRRKKQNHK